MIHITSPYGVWFASLTSVSSLQEDIGLFYIFPILCIIATEEFIQVLIVVTVVFVLIFYLTLILCIYFLSFMCVIAVVVPVILAFLLTIVMMVTTSKYW